MPDLLRGSPIRFPRGTLWVPLVILCFRGFLEFLLPFKVKLLKEVCKLADLFHVTI